MTNLQDVANPKTTQLQQRLLLGVPIGIGALVTALIVGVGIVPQWLRLQADSQRLAQLEEFQARIPLLRAQIAKTAEDQITAERRQRKVLQLIEGSGELATFLAQLDREATRLGVQLDLYEPLAAAPPPAATDQKPDPNAPPPPPGSPLEAAGLKAQKFLISAKGPYPSLLAFLRATEKLSVLVTQTNLSLAVVASPQAPQTPAAGQSGSAASRPAQPQTELKLMLTYYYSAAPVSAPVADSPAAPKN